MSEAVNEIKYFDEAVPVLKEYNYLELFTGDLSKRTYFEFDEQTVDKIKRELELELKGKQVGEKGVLQSDFERPNNIGLGPFIFFDKKRGSFVYNKQFACDWKKIARDCQIKENIIEAIDFAYGQSLRDPIPSLTSGIANSNSKSICTFVFEDNNVFLDVYTGIKLCIRDDSGFQPNSVEIDTDQYIVTRYKLDVPSKKFILSGVSATSFVLKDLFKEKVQAELKTEEGLRRFNSLIEAEEELEQKRQVILSTSPPEKKDEKKDEIDKRKLLCISAQEEYSKFMSMNWQEVLNGDSIVTDEIKEADRMAAESQDQWKKEHPDNKGEAERNKVGSNISSQPAKDINSEQMGRQVQLDFDRNLFLYFESIRFFKGTIISKYHTFEDALTGHNIRREVIEQIKLHYHQVLGQTPISMLTAYCGAKKFIDLARDANPGVVAGFAALGNNDDIKKQFSVIKFANDGSIILECFTAIGFKYTNDKNKSDTYFLPGMVKTTYKLNENGFQCISIASTNKQLNRLYELPRDEELFKSFGMIEGVKKFAAAAAEEELRGVLNQTHDQGIISAGEEFISYIASQRLQPDNVVKIFVKAKEAVGRDNFDGTFEEVKKFAEELAVAEVNQARQALMDVLNHIPAGDEFISEITSQRLQPYHVVEIFVKAKEAVRAGDFADLNKYADSPAVTGQMSGWWIAAGCVLAVVGIVLTVATAGAAVPFLAAVGSAISSFFAGIGIGSVGAALVTGTVTVVCAAGPVYSGIQKGTCAALHKLADKVEKTGARLERKAAARVVQPAEAPFAPLSVPEASVPPLAAPVPLAHPMPVEASAVSSADLLTAFGGPYPAEASRRSSSPQTIGSPPSPSGEDSILAVAALKGVPDELPVPPPPVAAAIHAVPGPEAPIVGGERSFRTSP